MDQNNIIDLTSRRTKAGKRLDMGKINFQLDINQKRAAVATALLSVLFMVTLANTSVFSQDPQGTDTLSSRDPASADRAMASVPTGTSDWEDQMVSKLSKASDHVQMGRRPDQLEKLTLEFLEGKYAVRLENGKIRELSFTDTAAQVGPKFLKDRTAFLDQNRELLPVNFKNAVKAESKASNDEVVEGYDLLDKSSATVAKVWFRLDKSGHLLSMQVQ